MKKIKPIKAYAIVKKGKMKLNVFDIFETAEVLPNKDELLIEVQISYVKDARITKATTKKRS